jgi:hypothetical protein
LLFGSGIFATVCRYIFARLKANDKKTEAVQLGVQALLRDRLISEYNERTEKGFAPIFARQNFENMWTHYHNLGENGVMDDIHVKYMALPTEPEA